MVLAEQTAVAEASLAKLYVAQRRNTEAEALLEQAIPVLEIADSSMLAVALNDLAEAYQRDGRYLRAEPLYSRLLILAETNPGVIRDDIRTGLRDYVQMLPPCSPCATS